MRTGLLISCAVSRPGGAVSAALLGLLCCCTAQSSGPEPRPGADGGGTVIDGGVPPAADGGARDGTPPGGDAAVSVGIVAIDIQETFVQSAANADIAQILAGAKTVFELAGSHGTPFLITYEDSKTASGYTLPASLQPAMPAGAREFIKTTFAATGQQYFAFAVRDLGLTHAIVLGAETDVCVLQTVLGLRTMGLAVVLLTDTVFSSEPHVAPAVRRMQQAGVVMGQRAQVQGHLESPSGLAPAPQVPVRLVNPLGVVAVLNHFDDAGVNASADPRKQAKQARFKELLLVSEWFDIPLYGTGTTLPAAFQGVLTTNHVRPLASLATEAAGKQVVVAGTDQDVVALIAGLRSSHEIFVMEDALLTAGSADQTALLEGLYQAGDVPITYKAFYYEMTGSIDPGQWPSQAWVDRYDVYYNKTSAPEDLPPMQ